MSWWRRPSARCCSRSRSRRTGASVPPTRTASARCGAERVTIAALSMLVPMAVACAMAGASAFTDRHQGAVAVAGAVAALGLTIALLARPDTRLLVWFGGWEPRHGVAVGVG